MLSTRFVAGILSIGLLVCGMGMVYGQIYPNKPIRVVTLGAGGGSDFVARLISQGVATSLGQQVIVDNRGTGLAAGDIVSKAPPDGYTLLVNASTHWLGPLLQSMPYDPVKDFSPITLVEKSPNVLVVHPSVVARSVKELIAVAKAKPGQLNYAASSPGGTSHLAAELFKAMAGVDIVHVAYKGSGAAATGVVAGEVQLIFGSATVVAPHLKSGKLRGLAVTSTGPFVLFPDLPTVSATVPKYEAVGMTSVFAPAKTPAGIINRLNQEIVRFLKTTEAKEKFLNIGAEAVGSSPEELAFAMKADTAAMGKLIKDLGIRDR